MKLSTPRVIASANPRNKENEPSVTMSGGSLSLVMKNALSPSYPTKYQGADSSE